MTVLTTLLGKRYNESGDSTFNREEFDPSQEKKKQLGKRISRTEGAPYKKARVSMVSLGPGRGHAIANTRQPVCVPPPVSLVVSEVTVRLDPVTLIQR